MSLGSPGFALGVHAFIWGRWVYSGSRLWPLCSSGVVVFTQDRRRGCWVHSSSPLGSLGSSGGRGIHPRSLGSIGIALGVVGFSLVRPGCSWVHPGSLCSLGFALGIVGVHLGSHCVSLGSSGVFGFTRVRRRGRWVHSGSLRGSFCSCGVVGLDLGVVGFIRDRWVPAGSPCG